MSTLYICEKPSQARDIAKILDASNHHDGYLSNGEVTVTWCYGHLLETKPPEHYCENLKPWRLEVLPVIPEEWEYDIKEDCKEQYDVIESLLEDCDEVVIATDADREGEVIAREVLERCEYQGGIKRLWLSALDDKSIKKALSQLKDGKETEDLYYAGLARQRADWLIGMNMTMAMSSQYNIGGVLSVGRVQTPTLNMIVNRDREIENFKPTNYYEVSVDYECDSEVPLTLFWQTPEDMIGDDQGHCLKKEFAQDAKETCSLYLTTITSVESAQKKQFPPLVFSLSALTKKASSLFGFGADETLKIAQSLYAEHKLTTYPRSDCGYLPMSQFEEAEDVLTAVTTIDESYKPLIELCDTDFKSKAWNDKKITAHHGIIPTLNTECDLSGLNSREKKLYDLIVRTYICQFLGFYQYEQTKIKGTCCDYELAAIGNVPLELGWKRAFNQALEGEDDSNESENKTFPKVVEGGQLNPIEAVLVDKKTKPPAKFTDGSLVDAMQGVARYVDDAEAKKILKENAGIGTEATRASIITSLLDRGYIEKKGKNLVSTKNGQALIDTLPDHLKDPMLTALWEQALTGVAEGEIKLDEFIANQVSLLEHLIDDLKQVDKKTTALGKLQPTSKHKCPECKSPLIKKYKKDSKKVFWSCSTYPECKAAFPDKSGKPNLKIGKNKKSTKKEAA